MANSLGNQQICKNSSGENIRRSDIQNNELLNVTTRSPKNMPINESKNAQHTLLNDIRNKVTMKPWKIMLQNIRGLVTENSKSKIDYLKEYIKDEQYVLMNFTETWLNKNIKDDAEIDGYKLFRGDRKGNKNGGTAIFVQDKLEAKYISEISHGKCEMIAIEIVDLRTINIVVYRPPKTKSQEFDVILNGIQEILNTLDKPDPTIILSGDFNFPFVKWNKMIDNSCTWDYISNTNATIDEKQQFEKLIKMCQNQCMLQTIEEPTREENTLDLLFTNENNLITSIEVNKSKLSDHNLIEMSTNYVIEEQGDINEIDGDTNSVLRQLNFHSKSIKWKEINEIIRTTN